MTKRRLSKSAKKKTLKIRRIIKDKISRSDKLNISENINNSRKKNNRLFSKSENSFQVNCKNYNNKFYF